jgi:mRNA (2'-O-methyladenosine-N6-)-methyltransferase
MSKPVLVRCEAACRARPRRRGGRAQVRETSRKPDELYPLLERLSPGTRKLEVFARQHNVRPGWVSLGNQLAGVQILDPDMRERYEAKYGALPAKEAAG